VNAGVSRPDGNAEAGTLDTHAHVWHGRRPWPSPLSEDPLFAPVRRAFSVNDLLTEMDDGGVGAALLVQSVPLLEETAELLAIAAVSPRIAGVVGWLDLRSGPAANRDLDRLRDGTGGELLVGIRHHATMQDDDPLVNGALIGAAELLADRGLTLEVQQPDGRRIGAVAALAGRVPGLRVVLDHLGRPDVVGGTDLQEWTEGLELLRPLPNLWIKYSGWSTRLPRPRPAMVKPFLDRVCAVVGVGRIVFGSNWPICEISGSYAETVAASRNAMTDLSVDEAEQVFTRNARDAYRIRARSA
jgi:L-fuconolactonase